MILGAFTKHCINTINTHANFPFLFFFISEKTKKKRKKKTNMKEYQCECKYTGKERSTPSIRRKENKYVENVMPLYSKSAKSSSSGVSWLYRSTASYDFAMPTR